MFQSLPVVALLALLLVFTSCERHHPGELPEVQREHLDPLAAGHAEHEAAEATPHAAASPTPANFFPSPTP